MNRLLRELRRVNLPTRFRRGGSALGEAGPGGGAGLKVATTATYPARSEVYRTFDSWREDGPPSFTLDTKLRLAYPPGRHQ